MSTPVDSVSFHPVGIASEGVGQSGVGEDRCCVGHRSTGVEVEIRSKPLTLLPTILPLSLLDWDLCSSKCYQKA